MHARAQRLIGVEDAVRPEPGRRVSPGRLDIGHVHALHPPRARGQQVKGTRHARADDQHGVPLADAGLALPAQRAAERLHHAAGVVRNLLRQRENAVLHIDGRHAHELGEAPGVEAGSPQHVAHGLATAGAVPAGQARHVVGRDDPIPHVKPVGTLTDRHHPPADLVSQHQGRLRHPIPLHQIASANAARGDLEEQLALVQGGDGARLEPQVVIVAIDRDPMLGREPHRFRQAESR